jgi:hypothetical protein
MRDEGGRNGLQIVSYRGISAPFTTSIRPKTFAFHADPMDLHRRIKKSVW